MYDQGGVVSIKRVRLSVKKLHVKKLHDLTLQRLYLATFGLPCSHVHVVNIIMVYVSRYLQHNYVCITTKHAHMRHGYINQQMMI